MRVHNFIQTWPRFKNCINTQNHGQKSKNRPPKPCLNANNSNFPRAFCAGAHSPPIISQSHGFPLIFHFWHTTNACYFPNKSPHPHSGDGPTMKTCLFIFIMWLLRAFDCLYSMWNSSNWCKYSFNFDEFHHTSKHFHIFQLIDFALKIRSLLIITKSAKCSAFSRYLRLFTVYKLYHWCIGI